MIPATEQQIEEACMTRSSHDAWQYLLSQKLIAYRSHCDNAISRLIEDGRRKKLQSDKPAADTAVAIEVSGAIDGCKKLLARMLATGHHWIHDPAKYLDALEQAEIAHLTRRAA